MKIATLNLERKFHLLKEPSETEQMIKKCLCKKEQDVGKEDFISI